MTYGHVWWFRRTLPERKGTPCRIVPLKGGRLVAPNGNIRVEFPDGFTVITSRHAVRRRKNVR